MMLSVYPKVSVIIPAFNEEKYIVRTLTALAEQDYPDFEIIVADNASTDHTAILVQQFAETVSTPVTLLYEARKGTNFAREAARQAAAGNIIAQLDADCIPHTDWISKGVALLSRKSGAVAVTGPYDYYDGSPWVRYSSLFVQKLIYPIVNRFVQVAGRAAILIGGNAFIYAATLEACGGYNTELTFYGDDVDLGKRLAGFGKVNYSSLLVINSSSRRYKANGFASVNKKYQTIFWNLFWRKDILLQTMESSHPR